MNRLECQHTYSMPTKRLGKGHGIGQVKRLLTVDRRWDVNRDLKCKVRHFVHPTLRSNQLL